MSDTCRIGKGNAGERSIDTNTNDGGTKGIGSGWAVGEAVGRQTIQDGGRILKSKSNTELLLCQLEGEHRKRSHGKGEDQGHLALGSSTESKLLHQRN